MYLKSIYFKNIRGFKREKIEFGKGINLLIGKNNSGKSTIIKAAYTLQNPNSLSKDDLRRGSEKGSFGLKLGDVSSRLLEGVNDDLIVFTNFYRRIESQNEMFFYNYQPMDRIAPEEIYQGFFLESFKTNLNPANGNVHHNIGAAREWQFLAFKPFPNSEEQNNFIYPFLAKRKTEHYDSQSNKQQTFQIDDTLRSLPSKVERLSNISHPQNKRFVSLCESILNFGIGTIPQ